MGPDHVPGQVPEPSPPAGPLPVRRSGPMTGLITGLMTVTVTRTVAVPVAGGTRPRLWISHGIQDARNLRLQHLHNSHPGATAKYPQPGQPVSRSRLAR